MTQIFIHNKNLNGKRITQKADQTTQTKIKFLSHPTNFQPKTLQTHYTNSLTKQSYTKTKDPNFDSK